MRLARLAGRRVPHEVSIVACGNADLLQWCDPPFTTVQVPIDPMCQSAVDLLLDRIEGRWAGAARRVIHDEPLCLGETTAPVR
jgi:DNA-binding LacI/PurR family transcriptional regulator